LISNLQLFSIGKFDFRMHHLLIIGILAISFSISVMLRSQAADYGLQLNEFDPFFNFRATQFLVDNGISEYLDWHDDMSWHPKGRDISATSQVMLHATAATMYKIFGGNMDLYEFTIIFPVVFGSMTLTPRGWKSPQAIRFQVSSLPLKNPLTSQTLPSQLQTAARLASS